ncbi:hypothetical protein [Actinacidiphila sp. bgisy167]|uniref:hypothetical protein n=1 Tax=Actinacidiphila sp. bgisy167 TaxID=3413797 RepID=UPI003D745CF7
MTSSSNSDASWSPRQPVRCPTWSAGRPTRSGCAGAYADRHPDEQFLRTPLSSLSALPLVGPGDRHDPRRLGRHLGGFRAQAYALTFYERFADSPGAQMALADAASLLDTAVLRAHRAASDMDRSLREGRVLTEPQGTRVRMDAEVTATRCREAVELLLSVIGAGAFASAHPLQRIWRDLGTASRHAARNPNLAARSTVAPSVGAQGHPAPLV